MNKRHEEVFLTRAIGKAWDKYRASLLDSSFGCWDYVVITASNEQQALGFKAQLAQRQSDGFLPRRTHFGVVPDPVGERVGNGGAMLGAMRYIAEHSGRSDFAGLKILVILSSGDSRRVPQYSALGKVFSPVPRVLPNGRSSTLFDEMMINTAGIPEKLKAGMLVLCGDVLLVFDADQVDLSGDAAVAISFPEIAETGAGHGVFLSDRQGYIAKVWHKQSVGTLKSYGAVDEQGCVNIDTGAVFFTPGMLSALYGLICNEEGNCVDRTFRKYVNGHIAPSLYVDFFYPLAADSTYEGYMAEIPEGTINPELLDARKKMWEMLRPFRIKLLRVSPSRFIHFGATPDVMHLMSTGIESYRYLGWERQINSVVRSDAAAFNSVLAEGAQCGSKAYLENSIVHSSGTVGSRSILSSIEIRDEAIPCDVVLHGLQQENGKYVVRIFGVNDNPKTTLEEGAELFGRPLSLLMSGNGLSETDLWPEGTAHSIWNAEFYAECDSMQEAVAAALNLYEMASGKGDPGLWRSAKRKSLSSSFNDADGEALIRWINSMRNCTKSATIPD
jgi:fucokinase